MNHNLSPAPIALFTYNRLDCLKKTVEALKANELASESDLFIFSDGPKPDADSAAVFGVRTYLKTISGFRSIHIKEAEVNMGLADSIITGVTEIVSRFGRIIVLEDDLVTSHHFLSFMNEALEFYEKEEKVAGIQGYCPFAEGKLPETYFTHEVGCLGWAAWARGWNIFEKDGKSLLRQFTDPEQIALFNHFNSYPYLQMLKDQTEGKVDSWAIRWYASVFLSGKLGLQPGRNLVSHIGYRNGTHCAESTLKPEALSEKAPVLQKIESVPADNILKDIYAPYNFSIAGGMPEKTSVFSRIINFMKRLLKAVMPYGILVLLRRIREKRK